MSLLQKLCNFYKNGGPEEDRALCACGVKT